MRRIKIYYPNLPMPAQDDQEGLQFYLKTWWSACQEMTDEKFAAAVEAHIRGPEGKWPLTPPLLWQAHRDLLKKATDFDPWKNPELLPYHDTDPGRRPG